MKTFLYVLCLLLMVAGFGLFFNQSRLVVQDVLTYGQRGWRLDEALIRAAIGIGGLLLATVILRKTKNKKTTWNVVFVFFALYAIVQTKLIVGTWIHAGKTPSEHFAVYLKRDAVEMAVTLSTNLAIGMLLWFSLKPKKAWGTEKLDFTEKPKLIIIDKHGKESLITSWVIEDVK